MRDEFDAADIDAPPGFLDLNVFDEDAPHNYENMVMVRLSAITGISLVKNPRIDWQKAPAVHVMGYDKPLISQNSLEWLAKQLGSVPSILQEIERLLGMKA